MYSHSGQSPAPADLTQGIEKATKRTKNNSKTPSCNTSTSTSSTSLARNKKRFKALGSVASVFLNCTGKRGSSNDGDYAKFSDEDDDESYQPSNSKSPSPNSGSTNEMNVSENDGDGFLDDVDIDKDIDNTDTAASSHAPKASSTITRLCDIGKKKREPSGAWEFFHRKVDKDGKVQCRTCPKKLKASGGTSNLWDHIKRDHQIQYEDYLKKKAGVSGDFVLPQGPNAASALQAEVESTSTNTNNEPDVELEFEPPKKSVYTTMKDFLGLKYPKNSKRRRLIDTKIALMCVRDFQPFSIVENNGFRELVDYLDPKYPMISRKQLTCYLLPDMWENCALQLRDALKNSIGGISLAADCWTSRANQSYLGITCHYINPDYTVSSAALDTVPIILDEKAETLAEILNAVMDEWQIKEKVVCLVTDNARNMIATAKLLNITHLPCYGHSLNLVIKHLLCVDDKNRPLTEDMNSVEYALENVITPCKNLVTYFNSSSKATRQLNALKVKTCKKEGKEVPEALKQQVDTRWNTSYYMLKSVMENIEFIKKINCDNELNLVIPKKEDIKLANDILKILQLFEYITAKISGSKYVTGSLILPMTRGLLNSLEKTVGTLTTPHGEVILKRAIRLVKERLVFMYEGRTLLKLSTLLDPRFKKRGFYFEQNYNDAVKLLKSTLADKMKKSANVSASPTPSTSTAPKPTTSNSSQSDAVKSMWDFLDEDDIPDAATSNTTAANSEVIARNYLERARIAFTDEPLQFWRNCDLRKSPLCELMLNCLCVPASSVPVERMFSATGYIITDRRNRISPRNLQMLSFLNINYRLYRIFSSN